VRTTLVQNQTEPEADDDSGGEHRAVEASTKAQDVGPLGPERHSNATSWVRCVTEKETTL